MKTVAFLLLINLAYLAASGQEKQQSKFFLNSVQTNLSKTFINPASIDSIRVNKEVKNGEVILFVDTNKFVLLTLEDVLKNHTKINNVSDSILFRINGKIIKDIKDLMIDKSFYIYVEIDEPMNSNYLSSQYHGLKIVNINLEEKERKPGFMIRGTNELLIGLNK